MMRRPSQVGFGSVGLGRVFIQADRYADTMSPYERLACPRGAHVCMLTMLYFSC